MYTRKRQGNVLPLPPGPNYALMSEMRQDMLELFTQLRQRYGDVVRFRLLPVPFLPFVNPPHVLVTDPEQAWEVLVKTQADGTLLYDRDGILEMKAANAVVGNGLVAVAGTAHRQMRKILQPAFKEPSLTSYRQAFIQGIAEVLRDSLREVEDIPKLMMRITMRNAASAFLSLNVDSSLLQELIYHTEEANRIFQEGMFSVPLPQWIPTRHNRAFSSSLRNLYRCFDRIIEQRRTLPQGEGPRDILSHLLAVHDSTGRPLSQQALRDELATHLLAGSETTASALTWTLYELARPGHEHYLQRLQQEVDTVLTGQVIRASHVAALPFTRSVFAESLRLYPPATGAIRRAHQETTIGAYQIHAGDVVVLSYYLTQRDPRTWGQDASRFLPERHSPSAIESKAFPRHAYTPFSQGPHKCIGEPSAWDEGVLVLAALAQHYTFEWEEGQREAIPQQQSVLWPREGLRLRVRPRKPSLVGYER